MQGVFESYPARWSGYEVRILIGDTWRGGFPLSEILTGARPMSATEFDKIFRLPALRVVTATGRIE
jgi:hypothetical protein